MPGCTAVACGRSKQGRSCTCHRCGRSAHAPGAMRLGRRGLCSGRATGTPRRRALPGVASVGSIRHSEPHACAVLDVYMWLQVHIGNVPPHALVSATWTGAPAGQLTRDIDAAVGSAACPCSPASPPLRPRHGLPTARVQPGVATRPGTRWVDRE